MASPFDFRWVFSSQIVAIWLLMCSVTGALAQSQPATSGIAKNPAGTVVAQGRLQPTKGILKLSALPGERIEKILIQPGAKVSQGDPLAILESARIKNIELEIAELKLSEARSLHQSATREAQLAIDAAELKFRSAQQLQKQAQANLALVDKQSEIIRSLDTQIQSLESIRNNPRLRGAVGSLEIETKRNQRINAQAEFDRSHLAASQAVESATDLMGQAQSAVINAQQAKADLDSNPAYRSLEKQIELLRIQLQLGTLVAPSPGTILQVSANQGERSTNLPIFELADLSEMSCVTEVHEADIGLVRIGQAAEMKSASLARPIKGKVARIDRVVGSPQIRSPNPLARSDFRSIAVWIQISPEDTPIASERVQLQVEVAITP